MQTQLLCLFVTDHNYYEHNTLVMFCHPINNAVIIIISIIVTGHNYYEHNTLVMFCHSINNADIIMSIIISTSNGS